MANSASLVEQIQDDILDHSIPLSSILRKAMVLAERIGSKDLRDWVSNELKGYRGVNDLLPDYRKSITEVCCNISNGVHFHSNMPAPYLKMNPDVDKSYRECFLIESVGELESWTSQCRNFSTNFRKPVQSQFRNVVAQHLTDTYRCTDAWQVIPPAMLAGVLDTVRTRLLAFVLEIQQIFPDADSIRAIGRTNSTFATQIFNRCIMAKHAGTKNYIQGNPGSNIATDSARISSSTASYQSNSTVLSTLKEIKQDAEQKESTHLITAVELLIIAAEENAVSKKDLIDAIETIARKDEGMALKLKSLCDFSAISAGQGVVKKAVDYVMNT